MESVQFSHSIMSNSLQPHGLQYARHLCPSPIPRACPHSWKLLNSQSPQTHWSQNDGNLLKTQPIRTTSTHLRPLPLILVFKNTSLEATRKSGPFELWLPCLLAGALQINITFLLHKLGQCIDSGQCLRWADQSSVWQTSGLQFYYFISIWLMKWKSFQHVPDWDVGAISQVSGFPCFICRHEMG